jgi:hypothetical protein
VQRHVLGVNDAVAGGATERRECGGQNYGSVSGQNRQRIGEMPAEERINLEEDDRFHVGALVEIVEESRETT